MKGWRRIPRYLPAFLASAAAVVTIAVVSRKLIRGGKGDFYVFYEAARRLAAGGDLYGTPTPFLGLYYHYAPAYAYLNIPFTWLGIDTAIVVWESLSLALCAWIFLAWHRALSGRPFMAQARRTRWTLGALTLLLILRPLLSQLNFAQSNILLMALLVAACLLLFRGRNLPGGAVLGFSLILKPFAAPFLLWRLSLGDWRSLLGASGGMAAALLLPAATVGLERNWSYHDEWIRHFWRTVAPGAAEWVSSNIVSLHATVHRLFSPVVVHHPDRTSETLMLIALPATALASIGLLLFVALGTWIVLAARRYRHDPVGVASVIFALTPLLSTTAQKHYFVLLLPACIYLVHCWILCRLRDGPILALVLVYLSALLATGELFAGRILAQRLQAFGVFSLGALALAAAAQRALALSARTRPAAAGGSGP